MSAIAVAALINEPTLQVKEIGLKWNKIGAVGGRSIALALENNMELKVLDLSWNSIGNVPPNLNKKPPSKSQPSDTIMQGDIGKIWGLVLSTNKSLIHLDLSFNKIGLLDT